MKMQATMRLPEKRLQLGSLGVAALLTSQAVAQQTPQSAMPQAPRAPTIEALANANSLDHADEGLKAPELAGSMELNLQTADGQDNDVQRQRNTGEAEVQLTLEYEQQLGPTHSIEARLQLASRRFSQDALNNEDEEFSYKLERLFYQWDPDRALRVRAGRFSLDDPMETIIDEDLDGVRLTYEQEGIEWDISQTRKDWFEAGTLERLDQITNTMVSVQFSPEKGTRWMPYILHRATEQFENIPEAEAVWLGIQGIVRPDNSPIRYWVHGSILDGEEIDDETSEFGGYLLDVGINWTTRGSFEPTYTLAIAHATGGARADRFRQSGLHSNDFALNGKNSFRYLGEVMDPELTNIQIVTVGAGFNLSRSWSTDIALHHYSQVEIEDSLRGSDVEFDPLGESAELGYGADIVLAYDPDRPYDIKGTAGLFEPGDAFENEQEMAWLAKIELSYDF
ncbi:MAG: alginate export family protein [Granulosicoccus sp.]